MGCPDPLQWLLPGRNSSKLPAAAEPSGGQPGWVAGGALASGRSRPAHRRWSDRPAAAGSAQLVGLLLDASSDRPAAAGIRNRASA